MGYPERRPPFCLAVDKSTAYTVLQRAKDQPVTSERLRVLFKSSAADFVVTELPAYPASGTGDHVFVRFTKENLTTDDAVRAICRALRVNPRDAGVAGVKDRVAVSSQTASFLMPKGDPEALLSGLAQPGLHIDSVTRHGHKLKAGHLTGNRFAVRLRPHPEGGGAALESALGPGLAAAARQGVPNAFGAQRFGRAGDNAAFAARFVQGEVAPPRDKKRARFMFSALQSELFNQLLDWRCANGTWGKVLPGDVAKKEENGALFDVPLSGPELEDAAQRGEDLRIAATGPMFGASMRKPQGEPAEWEAAILAKSAIDEDAWSRHRHLGEGTRRSLRLLVEELSWRAEAEDLIVEFVLGKGSYATTFLDSLCELVEPPRAAPPKLAAESPDSGGRGPEEAEAEQDESGS